MNIILCKPISEKATAITPCLGLGYLATAIRKKHEVILLDCVKEKMDFKDFDEFLQKEKPDIVGIQYFTCDHSSVLKMAKVAKESGCTVVVGGPHPTGDPVGTLKNKDIDFAFKGEAIKGFPMLIDSIENTNSFENIPGLIWRKEGKVIINDNSFDYDFEELPAWDLIKPDKYPFAPHGTLCRAKPAPIMITFGCPFLCAYCQGKHLTGSNIRKRSIESIINEIKLLYEIYSIREIHIEDDNFTLDKNYAPEVCKAIINLGFKDLYFACPNGVRLETLDEKLLKLMEQAGFYSFAIGIESGNNRILKKMGRNTTKEVIRKQIELIKNNTKIRMTGFCMMGYPTETLEEMEETAEFTRSLPIHKVQYGNFHPLPGTPIYDELKESGEIKDLDWDKFQDNTISYSPE